MNTFRTLFLFLLSTVFLGSMAMGQLLIEDFSYTAATTLTANGWTAHSGAGSNSEMVTAAGLMYPGYLGSGVGNAASFVANGEDVNKTWTSFPSGVTSGSLYYSVMMRIDTARLNAGNGDYIFHLYKNTLTFSARIFVRKSPGGSFFSFGIAKSSTPANVAYTDTVYTPGTTYLLAVKYSFIAGAANDTCALWVNPVIGGSEPAPTLLESLADQAATDIDSVYGVAIRQGAAAMGANGVVDGIRVGTSWADLFPDPTISSFPYNEGFELVSFPPYGWTETGTPGWNRETDKKHSGLACAGVIYTPAGTSFMQTPPIALPAGHRLKFWWNDYDVDYPQPEVVGTDSTFLEISTNGGTTWIPLDTLSRATAVNLWEEATHDLSAYAGTVTLRWRDYTDGTGVAWGVGVDDVLIEAIPSIVPPEISYDLVSSTVSGGAIVLTATIKDDIGVDSSVAGSPRLWYRSGSTIPLAGAYSNVTGSRVAPGDTNWTFAFPALSSGTFVEYYVAAQDDDTTATEPAGSPYTMTPPNGTVTTPNRFVVKSPLDFTVGAAGADFPSITEGLTWFYGGIDGSMQFLLNSDYTSGGETFPIILPTIPGVGSVANKAASERSEKSGSLFDMRSAFAHEAEVDDATLQQMIEARAQMREHSRRARRGSVDAASRSEAAAGTFNFTIKPNVGATPGPISGSSGAILAIYDLSNVTLDGLTIINTLVGGYGTLATLDIEDASDITVNNCVIRAGSGQFAVYAAPAVGTNTSFVFDSCDVSSNVPGTTGMGWGIFIIGADHIITNCKIYDFGGTLGAGTGIFVSVGSSNVLVENNEVYHTVPNAGSITGINIGSGAAGPVGGVIVRNNTVHDLNSSTAAGSLQGISASSTSVAIGTLIEGNIVRDLGATTFRPGNPSTIGLRAGTSSGTVISKNEVRDLSNLNTVNGIVGIIFTGSAGVDGAKATIQNNFVTLGNTGNPKGAYRGIWAVPAADDTTIVAFNSVYIGGAADSSATDAFIRSSGSATLRNNIFRNQRSNGAGLQSHYAIRSTISSGVFSSDYNDLYSDGASGAVLGSWVAVDQATLAAWQGASAGDSNSVEGDPLYIDPLTGNLHIDNSGPVPVVSNAGIAFGGVADDIDSEAGNRTTTPDMGADEFSMPAPAFTPSTSLLAFGSVSAGGTKEDSLYVKNTGTAALSISAVASDNALFTVLPASAPSIAAGDSAWFYVTFAPLVAGPQTGNIEFTNNGASSPDTVEVTGTGVVAPVFSANPSSLAFGSVDTGDTKQDSLYVKNTGNATLNILSATSDNAEFGVAPLAAVIAAGDSAWFYVTYAPAALGADAGNIVFGHDAATSPDTVAVSGTGVASGPSPKFLTVSPDTIIVKGANLKFLKSVKRAKPGKPITMPNWANLLDETTAQGGFGPNVFVTGDSAGGAVIGISYMFKKNPADPLKPKWSPVKDSANIYAWVRLTKWDFKKNLGKGYNALQKTIENKTFTHLDTAATHRPRGLDSTLSPGAIKRKQMKKQATKLDPKKTPNNLFAELVALKVNIAASQMEKTPAGFGELLYDVDSSAFDEMEIKAISEKADSMMTYWQQYTPIDTTGVASYAQYDDLYNAVYAINRAFVGVLDTASFMQVDTTFILGKLVLLGQVELSSVPFLKEPPFFRPVTIAPTTYEVESGEEEEFMDEEWDSEAGVPVAAKLYQNYPNPFNPSTTISFRLMEVSQVTVKIYNMLGQEVATLFSNEEFEEGYNTVQFDAAGLSSGVYFYQIQAQGIDEAGLRTIATQKMVLLK